MLGSGKAGFSEAREAVAKYEEESPLFGLVVYKRKKALLKYVPEGTSRLLQGASMPAPSPSSPRDSNPH